jgi:hypothetical protein
MSGAKKPPSLVGHEYAAQLWAGRTVKQIALDAGVTHVAVINGLARAGHPPASVIKRQRDRAIQELIAASAAAEKSLRYLGGSLHADRLTAALKPFATTHAEAQP